MIACAHVKLNSIQHSFNILAYFHTEYPSRTNKINICTQTMPPMYKTYIHMIYTSCQCSMCTCAHHQIPSQTTPADLGNLFSQQLPQVYHQVIKPSSRHLAWHAFKILSSVLWMHCAGPVRRLIRDALPTQSSEI